MNPADEQAQRVARLLRLGKNALALLGAYVIPRGFTVVAIVLAARVLGSDGFGAYGTAAAFAVILSILATLGMHPLLVRDLARDPAAAPRLIRAAHLVKTAANAVMLVLLYLLARGQVGLSGEALDAALLLGVSYAIGAYVENLSAYFQAVERMHVWTEASALVGLITGGLGIALVLGTHSVAWFALAPLLGQAAGLGWLLFRAPAEVRRGAPARREDLDGLLRALAPFALAFIVLTLHYKLDVLLLERWRSAAEVGLYAAAYKFVDVFHAVVIIGVSAVFPALSRSAAAWSPKGDAAPPRGAEWSGRRTGELALLAAVPVAGALHLVAGPAIRLAFGAPYGGAAPTLEWLALGLPALTVNLLGGYLLGAAHRPGWFAALYLGGLALKTAMDAALVPRLGPLGAAVAMAGAETALALAMLLALRRFARAAPGARALVAAVGAGALIVAARAVAGPGVGAAFAYLAAVLLLYTATGVLHASERRALRYALRHRGMAAETP